VITVLECALLSGAIYHPNWKQYQTLKIKKASVSKISKIADNAWYHITNVDRHMSPHHPFYAALYMKFRDRKPIAAVVAIRGTVMSILGNDVVDVVSWWSDALANGKDDRIPAYVNHAWMFVVKYLKIAHRHGLTLKLTGHSLGGSIVNYDPACK